MTNYTSERSGLSLIETLLYLAVSAVILLSVSSFFSLMLQARAKNQIIAEVEQQGLAATHIILQTIRNASSINSPVAGFSSASTLLVVPTAVSSPTVFDLSAGVLRVTEGVIAAVNLTNSRVVATNLNFYNLTRSGTSGVLRVQFTLSQAASGATSEFNYSKTFYASASLR